MSFGSVAVGGYSAFFDPALARPGNGAEISYNAMPRFGRSSGEVSIARLLAKGGFRATRRVMRALNGAAPGGAASETYARVSTADQTGPTSIGPGGVRAIETATLNSGVTTAAQETYIDNLVIDPIYNQAPTSYPVDLSGNGGGGKVGF